MLLRGHNFSLKNAQAFLPKKSGLAKKEYPSFRSDLLI